MGSPGEHEHEHDEGPARAAAASGGETAQASDPLAAAPSASVPIAPANGETYRDASNSNSDTEDDNDADYSVGLSDFEPLRRFPDDDNDRDITGVSRSGLNNINNDSGALPDVVPFDPLPPLQSDGGIEEEENEELDPTLLALLAKLGNDDDQDDEDEQEQDQQGQGQDQGQVQPQGQQGEQIGFGDLAQPEQEVGSATAADHLAALSGSYREPTGTNLCFFEEDDEDGSDVLADLTDEALALFDAALEAAAASGHPSSVEDLQQALETGAELTNVFDDNENEEQDGSSAETEALTELGALSLGGEEGEGESSGAAATADAGTVPVGQGGELDPFLPAFCLPCADQPFLNPPPSTVVPEPVGGLPSSGIAAGDININGTDGAGTGSTFALTVEEQEEEERKLREKRNALLTLSALGRRKLGSIAEEEVAAGKGPLALNEEQGQTQAQLPQISRLSYDLDSIDIDSVTAPEDLLGPSDLRIGWDTTGGEGGNNNLALSLPPGFEDNFEAAVMQHLMEEMAAAGGHGEEHSALMQHMMEEMAAAGGHGEEHSTGIEAADAGENENGTSASHPVEESATVAEDVSSQPGPTFPGNQSAVSGAASASLPFLKSFGSPPAVESPKNERQMIGHKGKIFGMAFSPCGSYLATASEDSTVNIWDVTTHRCLHTLAGHSRNHEVLRVAWSSSKWKVFSCLGSSSNDDANQRPILGTGGADGVVRLWEMQQPSSGKWHCFAQEDHTPEIAASDEKEKEEENNAEGVDTMDGAGEEDDESPQIYALQFIDNWAGHPVLLTSSDDCVNIWTLDEKPEKEKDNEDRYHLTRAMTLRFSNVHHANGGVSYRVGDNPWVTVDHFTSNETHEGAFGGHRNPDNIIYVFDASYNEASGLLGVALADGTLRLVNPRGICLSVLSLPGCESHLTSFAWDSTGTRLASCVGTGHIVLWYVELPSLATAGAMQIRVHCTCVLGGGHAPGRPIFGVKFFAGDTEDLLLSWGVDGKLCIWDRSSEGEIYAPIGTLVAKSDYPIYACDVTEIINQEDGDDDDKRKRVIGRIAIGGGNDGGFMGVPAFIYDVSEASNEHDEQGKVPG